MTVLTNHTNESLDACIRMPLVRPDMGLHWHAFLQVISTNTFSDKILSTLLVDSWKNEMNAQIKSFIVLESMT